MASRVKPLKLTQAEHQWLTTAVDNTPTTSKSDEKLRAQCLAKLADAVVEHVAGIAAGPMEATMMTHARGKLAKMVTGAAYARATQLLTKLEATEQDMVDLGKWLAKQGWLTGTVTLVTVLGKWDEWLPRARADVITRAPAGFGDDDGDPGQNPTTASAAGTHKRSGF